MTDAELAALREAAKGHTPGPWVADVNDPNDCVVFVVADGEWVANVADGPPDEKGRRWIAFDQTVADSHLIAAAPALLAHIDALPSEPWERLNVQDNEIAALRAEVAALRLELAAERERNQSTYCAYCGDYTVRLDDPEAVAKVEKHIATCAKHPMRKTEDALRLTRAERDAAASMLLTVQQDCVALREALRGFYDAYERADGNRGCFSCSERHDSRCQSFHKVPKPCSCGRVELDAAEVAARAALDREGSKE